MTAMICAPLEMRKYVADEHSWQAQEEEASDNSHSQSEKKGEDMAGKAPAFTERLK